MSEEPKHCPFCASPDAVLWRRDSDDVADEWFSVSCDDCGCEGPVCYSEEDAIVAWNRRTHGPATQAAIDQLIELSINPNYGAGFGENICAVVIEDRAALLREQGVG